MRRQLLFIAAAALCAAALFARTLQPQGVAIAGSSFAQYIGLRPLAIDSVPLSETDSAWGSYRRTSSGVLARCVPGAKYCTFYRSGPQRGLTAMMQDLDVTAWGLGQGLSLHGELRGRTSAGDGELWPQATQRVDAIAVYLEAARGFGRVRLGRQWVMSPLGMYNFDGGAFASPAFHRLTAEVYGGSALLEGLNRPVDDDALAPVEDLPPTSRGMLIGATAQYRPDGSHAIKVQYQREIAADRSQLYSERIAATTDLTIGSTTWTGQLTHDLATGANNDLSGSVRLPILRHFEGTLSARHYVPFFDLWTIWGAFSPVAFNEVGGDLRWAAKSGAVAASMNGSYRAYDDTHTGLASLPLRSDGWHLGASALGRPATALTIDGRYQIDIGFGASGSNGDVALQWAPSDRLSLAVHGTAFQTIQEFQVGEGFVFGAGGEAEVQLIPGVRLVSDLLLYRHDARGQPQLVDWNQTRASVRVDWALGGASGWDGLIGKTRRDAP